ncbi:MAG: prolyl oligopeptidase family serine peptidase [Chitinophagales bacterium]|nr:prolyl oligopeptidase family serine peptidase [Chitinophagales bacterium]
MKKIFLFTLSGLLSVSSWVSAQNIKYPKTDTIKQVDDYFGTKISDPYRWLENDTAKAVMQWVDQENAVTEGYLSTVPYRDKIKTRLKELQNYTKIGSPFKKGNYLYYSKNDGLQNQAVIYRHALNNELPTINSENDEVFIDPNLYAKDGTVSLGGMQFNKENTLMTYTLAKAGSDWQTMYVKDVITGRVLADTIRWVKFGGTTWHGNGFFYSGYPKPDEKKMYSNESVNQKVYYHTLGTPQSEDQIVYEDDAHAHRYYSVYTTEEERYLFLDISEGTYGTELWYKDIDGGEWKLLFAGFENEYSVIDTYGDNLYVLTNDHAPNKHLVRMNINENNNENWTIIIPEQEMVLDGVGLANKHFFAHYLQDAKALVTEYGLDGEKIRGIDLPGIGTISSFGGERLDNDFYYTFNTFTSPASIFHYNCENGMSDLYKAPELKYNPDDYVTEQVFYNSTDGAKVPMFIVHKKGIKLDGNNPCLLYSYGGFSINLTPSYSASRMLFLENGGIYAMPNIRGGNEYGEKWHKGGMLENKQQVFNDFITAAEWLIKNKYTSKSKLAISGRSNGGLLIGACMTQRPDLFKVALPGVGVLDMLRYHKFTVGWGWSVEYGNSDSKEAFNYLIKYSPLHNVRKAAYPATLVTTGDHDDRVVPAHSFKFAATLQKNNTGKNPSLIRIDKSAGHGAGKPLSKQIDEDTDVWSFVFYNLGMNY